jgi:hypothetical protein
MVKFTKNERILVKNLVATLSLRRLSDNEIIKDIENQTGEIITRQALYKIKLQIKKDSYHWYTNLQKNQYGYLHEFRERINEVLWLQQKHNEMIEKNEHNPSVQQVSLAELHRLNITLSNYFA